MKTMTGNKTKTIIVATLTLLLALVAVIPTVSAQVGDNIQYYWNELPYLGIIWSRPRFDTTLALYVEGVVPNSPADVAGIRRGDYIVAVQKGFDFFLPHEMADYCRAGDVVLVIAKRKTGTEPWWTLSTFGRYVRLAARPNRPLREGEV